MKKILTLLFIASISIQGFSQEKVLEKRDKRLPDMIVHDINGKEINPSKISNNGNPIIINFWATWCSPCKRELNAINDVYIDWQDETGVKLIAVAIDDQRTMSRIKPYVDGVGWEYEIWVDPNWAFKRAMGVNNPPFTFLIDGEGKIVYVHNNYSPGDEHILYEKLIELVNKKKAASETETSK